MSRIISSIDLGKFFASILIVVVHCRPLSVYPQMDYYLTGLCRIAVPFFFIASSYFFFKSEKDIWTFVKRLLLLYLAWFVIELPLTVQRFFIDTDNSLLYNCFLFFRGLFINSTFYASWFITALWQGVLIVWWLSKKINNKWLFGIGIICFIIACMWSMYRETINGTVIWPFFKVLGVLLAPSNSFIIAIPYCIIGKYFAEHPNLRINKPAAIIPIVMILALELWLCRNIGYMSDSYFSLIVICPILFLFLLNWDISFNPTISKFLRNCSILIYLLHLPVLHLLNTHLHSPLSGFALLSVVFLCSLFFASIIIFASKKIRILKYLY